MGTTSALIVIDGSHGEGGGALLRTALAMAALTQQNVRIDYVRGNTRFPALDAEDLTLLAALARSCQADVVGAEVGSNTVTFLPRTRPRGLQGRIDAVRNASGRGPNAPIVLNTLMPVLARSGTYSSVVAMGETFGHNSLSFDYFANVTVEALKRAGLYSVPDLLRPGFGRESEGEVAMDIEPSVLTGLQWESRGGLKHLGATVSTSGLPPLVGQRAAEHLKRLANSASVPIEIDHEELDGRQTGAFVTVWAHYERGMGGGAAMGSRGAKAETIAEAAFQEAFDWMATSATVDEFLADQLLLPLALANEESSFTVPRLTQRLLTAIWVIKQFAPIHITVRGTENGPGAIRIGNGSRS
jgi:RNA 3'-terminal phosphate cyclase (ATP)